MRFGSDLNAFTSFDETIYMLKVPTDSPQIMQTAFLVLEDWAHGLTFDPKAIDKERGIIVEEWRLGQGADARMRDKQIPGPPQRLALRRAPARRQEGGHRDLRLRHAQALLPDLVPPGPDGRRRRGRFRQGQDRGAHQEALRPAHRPARRARPAGLSHPRPRRDALRHRRGQGGHAEHRRRLPQAAAGRPETRSAPTAGCSSSASSTTCSTSRLAEIAQKPDPPFLGAVSSRGRFVGTEGRLRPLGPRRRGRHRPRAPGPLHGRGAGGPLRLHRDRARAPQERDPCAISSGP